MQPMRRPPKPRLRQPPNSSRQSRLDDPHGVSQGRLSGSSSRLFLFRDDCAPCSDYRFKQFFQADDMSRLTIGALAAEAGVKLETIRFYERVGVMPKPDRTEGGHRSYTLEHRKRLVFVRRARELGFSLDDVRTLLHLSQPKSLSCAEAESIAATHLGRVRAKIADLVRLEGVLANTVSRCGAHADPSCPLIEMLVGDGSDRQSI